jgi:hypothetical protein
MHSRVTFPDFSAFQMTVPAAHAAPAALHPTNHTPDSGAAAATPTFQGAADAAPGRAHVSAPPFSWLGGDAWPNFAARADTPP